MDLDSTVTREVVVRPANEPEHEVVELLAAELEKVQACGSSTSTWALWRVRGWPSGRRKGCTSWRAPGPKAGSSSPKTPFIWTLRHGMVTCPGGVTVPMAPGRTVQFPASACDACRIRTQCTHAQLGHGRSLHSREDEPFQQKLRAKIRTTRGRASLRKRTAVEHAISHQLAHQGRRARYKGLRKNQFDGRRHAAVSNLQVAARYAEERVLAS